LIIETYGTYFDDYLKDPYCIEKQEIKHIFSEALIYYGGQYCIDLELSRDVKDLVTGLHYMPKNNNRYKIESPYNFFNKKLETTLSYFLKNEKNQNGEKFSNPDTNYTLLLTSCRESENLDPLIEDNLVFYEQILKRLNFKVIYDKVKDLNIDSKYTKCKIEKNKKIYMNPEVKNLQYERKAKVSKGKMHPINKGKIKSRNTNNTINNNTVLINSNNVEHEIKILKDNIKSIKDINDISKKSEIFENIFRILHMNTYKELSENFISLDTKIKTNIIKTIFDTNYNLMFEFLFYCQLNIKQDKSNSKTNNTNNFFLEYVFNNINKKDIDISKINYSINLKILRFIIKNFKDQKLNMIIIDSNNIGYNDAIYIASILRSTLTAGSIKKLEISDNNIDDKCIRQLSLSLKDNKSIISLNISRNKIGDIGANYVADVLKENTTLTELDISNNNVGDEGAIALAEALKHNSTLTSLKIDGNTNIGEDTIKELKKITRIHI